MLSPVKPPEVERGQVQLVKNLPSTSMVWLGEMKRLAVEGEHAQLSQKSCSIETGPLSSCLPPTPATSSAHRQTTDLKALLLQGGESFVAL